MKSNKSLLASIALFFFIISLNYSLSSRAQSFQTSASANWYSQRLDVLLNSRHADLRQVTDSERESLLKWYLSQYGHLLDHPENPGVAHQRASEHVAQSLEALDQRYLENPTHREARLKLYHQRMGKLVSGLKAIGYAVAVGSSLYSLSVDSESGAWMSLIGLAIVGVTNNLNSLLAQDLDALNVQAKYDHHLVDNEINQLIPIAVIAFLTQSKTDSILNCRSVLR